MKDRLNDKNYVPASSGNSDGVVQDEATKSRTYYVLDRNNYDKLEKICHAFGSPIRLKMIQQLTEKPMTLIEIARLNGVTNSTALFHLNCLIEGGIVDNRYLPGVKGKAQVFFVNFTRITFDRGELPEETLKVFEQEDSVGDYIDIDCEFFGIATEEKMMLLNREEAFLSERKNAELIWMKPYGGVYYPFQNYFAKNADIEELSFSFEICSETSFYRNDWKSDITFYINDTEICTYTSPGDFGGVRGRLNPPWWPNESTQFGNFITLSVRNGGSFLNNEKSSDVSIKNLDLTGGNKIVFGIKIKPTAKYIGGFNIFGKKFGNYEQGIKMTAKYKSTSGEEK